MVAAQNEFDPTACVMSHVPPPSPPTVINQQGGFCARRQIHPYALMRQFVFTQLAEGGT